MQLVLVFKLGPSFGYECIMFSVGAAGLSWYTRHSQCIYTSKLYDQIDRYIQLYVLPEKLGMQGKLAGR
jgi:hypothetical protein